MLSGTLPVAREPPLTLLHVPVWASTVGLSYTIAPDTSQRLGVIVILREFVGIKVKFRPMIERRASAKPPPCVARLIATVQSWRRSSPHGRQPQAESPPFVAPRNARFSARARTGSATIKRVRSTRMTSIKSVMFIPVAGPRPEFHGLGNGRQSAHQDRIEESWPDRLPRLRARLARARGGITATACTDRDR